MKAIAITASVIFVLIGLCGVISMGVEASENRPGGSWQFVVFALVGLAIVGLISYVVKSARSGAISPQTTDISQPQALPPVQQEHPLPPPQSKSGGVLFVPRPLDEQNRPGER